MAARLRLRTELLLLVLGAITLCGIGGGLLVAELIAAREASHQVMDVYTPAMEVGSAVVRRLLEVERDVGDVISGGDTGAAAARQFERDVDMEDDLLRTLDARATSLEHLPPSHGAASVAADLRGLTQEFTGFLADAHQLARNPPTDVGWRPAFRQRRDALTRHAEKIGADLRRLRDSVARRMEAHTRRIVRLVVSLFVVIVVTAAAAAMSIGRRLARPIEALALAADKVRTGTLDVAMAPAGSDETFRLGTAFNDMMEGLRQKERIKQTFGKYLDPRVVQRLVAKGADDLRPQAARMTIGYVNMSGFTRRAETLPPDRLVAVLNAFLDAVARPVADRGGVIDKTIGDTLMFVFGPPFGDAATQARLAAEAAVAQRSAASDLAERLTDFADGDLRIGIATGAVLLGPMGADMSRAYTVIGDAANVAAKIEWANRVYGTRLLTDGETRKGLPADIACRALDTVLLPGKSAPTELYEILGAASDLSPAQREFVSAFEAALAAWRAGNWAAARERFDVCAALNRSDVPTAVFLQRLDLFSIAPPEGEWRGVWRLTDHP